MESEFQSMGSSSVKLIKNSKGYNWEIKVYDKEGLEMVKEIEKIDAELKARYLEVER